MSLLERITADSVTATKDRTEPDRMVLRSLVAALKNERIASGGELDEAAEVAVIQKQLKQREEAAASYASRPELAKQEQAEAAVIKRYLPKPMSTEEIAAAVDAAIADAGASSPRDIGTVMGLLKPQLDNPADLGRAAALVKEKLQQSG